MAYEGLDAPEVAVVAALTHIRSRPWLEQMIARATRVDPHAGAYETQRALVYHPDDPLFAKFRQRDRDRAGHLGPQAESASARRSCPCGYTSARGARDGAGGITPLESNALGLRYATLRPGTRLRGGPPEHGGGQAELIDPPSVLERRLRPRIGEMVAAQAVEDEADLQVPQRARAVPPLQCDAEAGPGQQGPGGMTLPELEAALAWLERNRLADHLHLLDGDSRYAWTATRRRRALWKQLYPQSGPERQVHRFQR